MRTKIRILFYSVFIGVVIMIWAFSDVIQKNNVDSDLAKIALRQVGNQLLLTNNDSTSLITPIIKVDEFTYKLAFDKELTILPNDLVNITKANFKNAKLPESYRVAVIKCSDNEVAYSYRMSDDEEQTIIPCSGRYLPKECYTIKVHLTDHKTSVNTTSLWILLGLLIAFVLVDIYILKTKTIPKSNKIAGDYTSIGTFKFYQDQNKLVREALEINLSKKECELLALFIAQPNEIIKREVLTKKVWEDKGVFVSRSLDTYISKIRKKLKDDDSVTIRNVHGIGYKLEVL